MWFRVKEKDILVEAKYVAIESSIFGKGKVSITCRVSGADMATTLCTYESMEEAKRVFEDIQNSIAQGEKLYIMS